MGFNSKTVAVQFEVATAQAQAALAQLATTMQSALGGVETGLKGAGDASDKATGAADKFFSGWRGGMLMLNQASMIFNTVVGGVMKIAEAMDKQNDMLNAAKVDLGSLIKTTGNLVSTNDLLAASNRMMNSEYNIGQAAMERYSKAAWVLSERTGASWTQVMEAIQGALRGQVRGIKEFLPAAKDAAAAMRAIDEIGNKAAVSAGSLADSLSAMGNAAKNMAAGLMVAAAGALNDIASAIFRTNDAFKAATNWMQWRANLEGRGGEVARLTAEYGRLQKLEAVFAEAPGYDRDKMLGKMARLAVGGAGFGDIRDVKERMQGIKEQIAALKEAAKAEEEVLRFKAETRKLLGPLTEAERAKAEAEARKGATAALRDHTQAVKAAAEWEKAVGEAQGHLAEAEAEAAKEAATAVHGLAEAHIKAWKARDDAANAARKWALQESIAADKRTTAGLEAQRREGEGVLGSAAMGMPAGADIGATYQTLLDAKLLQQSADLQQLDITTRLKLAQGELNQELQSSAAALESYGQIAGPLAGSLAAGFEAMFTAIMQGEGSIGKIILKAVGMSLYSAGMQGWAEAMLTLIKAVGYSIWNPPAAAAAYIAAGKQFALSSVLIAAGAGLGYAGGGFDKKETGGGGAGGAGHSPGVGGGGGEQAAGPINIYIGDNALVTADAGALAERLADILGEGARRGRVGTADTGSGKTLKLDGR